MENDGKGYRRRSLISWTVTITALLVVTAVVSVMWIRMVNANSLEELTRQLSYTFQNEIEGRGSDSGNYPPSIEFDDSWYKEIRSSNYYNLAYLNPYTNQPVNLVSFSKRAPGEITYIHIPAGIYGNDEVREDCYYLVTYCGLDRPGQDIDGDGNGDGVLLVLESGWSHRPRPYPAILDTPWKAIEWQEVQMSE